MLPPINCSKFLIWHAGIASAQQHVYIPWIKFTSLPVVQKLSEWVSKEDLKSAHNKFPSLSSLERQQQHLLSIFKVLGKVKSLEISNLEVASFAHFIYFWLICLFWMIGLTDGIEVCTLNAILEKEFVEKD